MKVYLLMANTEEDTQVLAITFGDGPAYSTKKAADEACAKANFQLGRAETVTTCYGQVLPRFVVEELTVAN
jgi:hypothetical protein